MDGILPFDVSEWRRRPKCTHSCWIITIEVDPVLSDLAFVVKTTNGRAE